MLIEKAVFNVREVKEVLGISRGLVYELIAQGQLPSVRLGRRRLLIPRAALMRFLEDRAQKSSAMTEDGSRDKV